MKRLIENCLLWDFLLIIKHLLRVLFVQYQHYYVRRIYCTRPDGLVQYKRAHVIILILNSRTVNKCLILDVHWLRIVFIVLIIVPFPPS